MEPTSSRALLPAAFVALVVAVGGLVGTAPAALAAPNFTHAKVRHDRRVIQRNHRYIRNHQRHIRHARRTHHPRHWRRYVRREQHRIRADRHHIGRLQRYVHRARAHFRHHPHRRAGHARGFVAQVMRAARSRRGSPYRYGATGPHAFDCSGYVQWVYRRAGVRLPRTSAAQARRGHRVRHARRGDLVAWGRPAYHVAIYAGHGHIWSAPHSGSRVARRPIWRAAHYFVRLR